MGEEILIMGGGVIGLSCAFELQQRGHKVTVLETVRCGGQASGAAAGMLAPYSENVEGPDDFFLLCRDSLGLYPSWQQRVKDVSGLPFEYSNTGSLYLAYHEADLLALEGRLLWQRRFGSSGRIIEGNDLFKAEPYLSRDIIAALYTPEESHIYAPHYVKALEQACLRLGVRIEEELRTIEVIHWLDELALQAGDGRIFTGDHLVVCTGAWAKELERTFNIQIPIYPIRGQICAYESKNDVAQHMVFGNQGYLVSKDNGTLVCGASEDIAGFDTSVTERGIAQLERWNKRIFPFLESLTPFHRWAGLRPSTQDGFPLIGPLQQAGHIIFAAGHYRNGILLSPVTAHRVADAVDGRFDLHMMQSFLPERFSREGAAYGTI